MLALDHSVEVSRRAVAVSLATGWTQNLAAAPNHSAFNAANALGPWLGGMAIARACHCN